MAELFDTRLYRTLGLNVNGNYDTTKWNLIPHTTSSSYVGDFYETPASTMQGMDYTDEQIAGEKQSYDQLKEFKNKRYDFITDFYAKNWSNNMAPFSAIHPYALIKLAGASGSKEAASGKTIDNINQRKFYEVDGDSTGGYASSPTTSALINWGNQDPRGRTPYAFQDFVFCKYWNKIENNRLITLRRYPMPVPDSIEPSNYDSKNNIVDEPFAPVCTAVTYFGEGTGNTLSDILSFTVGYEWSELKSDVWNVTSAQNNEGSILGSGSNVFLSQGLKTMSLALGFLGDLSGKNPINPMNATNAPPDPYQEGPYENRIVGPINVINSVMKRERGLKFTQDGLEINFDYMSRPIANINNKAILLDILANILLMTTSSGTFFGGLHRYRTETPAVYPWRNADVLNALYKGKIFGKDGAPAKLIKTSFDSWGSFIVDFAKDILGEIKSKAGEILNSIGLATKTETSGTGENSNNGSPVGKVVKTVGKMVSAHLLKNATIPYLQGMKALLSGDPTGEWHLTIGNPLNPIAMIGNLIVDTADIKFSDELGPDDFPIGFSAKIKLKHALGRDKDAVESMYNRGYGRIYSLPTEFKTYADGESKVDAYTGTHVNAKSISNTYMLYTGGGNMKLMGLSNPKLYNSGTAYSGNTNNYNLNLSSLTNATVRNNSQFMLMPWQSHWNM